jgi:proteic killer suppression protein
VGEKLHPTMELSKILTVSDKIESTKLREIEVSDYYSRHIRVIPEIVDRLDASVKLQDMNYPGSNLHQLKGELKGVWSVKVSGNWRISFKFVEVNAYVVDYLDYH